MTIGMDTVAKIALLPGDGIGPEVMAEGRKVLEAAGERCGLRFDFFEIAVGGAAIDAYGLPIRSDDIERCRQADAVLLGAVGGPKWDKQATSLRPEQGLLALRKALALYANLRPVTVVPALAGISPIKEEILRGTDLLVVRELTGGLYFGRPSRQWRERRGRVAIDTLLYREHEIARVTRLAFDLARQRRRKVTSVDKANVLETSRLWRNVVMEVARDFPDVELDHVLVDAMAMHLIRQPARFDVVVTENMFGDILTDEASVLAGSLGLLPSASIGAARESDDGRRFGLFEPIHGSAPDIAGSGRANPVGLLLSAALMLRIALGLDDAAILIENAVGQALADGVRTMDLAQPDTATVTTAQFGDRVVGYVLSNMTEGRALPAVPQSPSGSSATDVSGG